jgi:hypothetical protein
MPPKPKFDSKAARIALQETFVERYKKDANDVYDALLAKAKGKYFIVSKNDRGDYVIWTKDRNGCDNAVRVYLTEPDVAAIKELNERGCGKVIEHHDITTDGQPLPAPIYGGRSTSL